VRAALPLRPALARRAVTAATAAALAVTALAAGGGAPDASASPTSTLDRLARVRIPSTTTQVVVVTARSWSTSYATLEAFGRRDGTWVRTMRVPARVGYAGMQPRRARVQGSGETPAGRFPIRRTFGLNDDPGTRMPYRHADGSDHWVYDPRDARTYNVWQPFRSRYAQWRRGAAERIADYPVQYRYGAVLGYNLPRDVSWSPKRRQREASAPADTRKGGGIFLHVNGSGATAGCVSVDEASMVRLLRWMRPARRPVVVAGEDGWLATR
jgi:L,D-peptidoglycan transpeptidase YkuD (ErfK/YbiS/YcfS/YnhG family)